jgi:hypothetical protein
MTKRRERRIRRARNYLRRHRNPNADGKAPVVFAVAATLRWKYAHDRRRQGKAWWREPKQRALAKRLGLP